MTYYSGAFAPPSSTSRAKVCGIITLFTTLTAIVASRGHDRPTVSDAQAAGTIASAGTISKSSSYRGVLTFATPGNGDPFAPGVIEELDLESGEISVKFDGLDPSRSRTGEVAFVSRLAPGLYADHAIVVADSRGVPGPQLFVCKRYSYNNDRHCGSPKLSGDGRRVAFTTRGGGGSVCENNYRMKWGDYVVVRDRRGGEVARFEGYTAPEWLPDGRLLMMGTQCRRAGVWVANASLRSLSRIDGDQVNVPAWAPAASPDGRRLAFVLSNQLWQLSLTGRPELTQLTHLPKSVMAATWSPDGGALALLTYDVTMPIRSLVLFRPGDERSMTVRPLPLYPYGPLSWR
ncbi:MAG TPA: hypothetical protein VM076_18550 [Gemmatimonadaceae bacterium]|nr:hypothetical protein [Gemmatimonadaceae bacterium]